MDDRIGSLLTYEGILGAVVIDREGEALASSGLNVDDATMISALAASAFGAFPVAGASPDALPRSYATFELDDGQIHLSAGRRLALVLLTDPELDIDIVKGLLDSVLTELEQPPDQDAPPG